MEINSDASDLDRQMSVCRITFETRSVRDAATVATPASRDATASAAQIAIGATLVPTHMSKERFGATSHFAASLAKPCGLAETAKLGNQVLPLLASTHPAVLILPRSKLVTGMFCCDVMSAPHDIHVPQCESRLDEYNRGEQASDEYSLAA